MLGIWTWGPGRPTPEIRCSNPGMVDFYKLYWKDEKTKESGRRPIFKTLSMSIEIIPPIKTI